MLRSFKEPFAQMQQATEEIASTAMANKPNTLQRVQVATPSLTERLLGGGAQFAAGTSVVFVLVYFLLSAGNSFLRKLVSVIPTFRDKKRTVGIIRSIESDISFYLVMMLATNAGLGLGVAAITAVLGIPDPLLWGALTLVLSFAPYIGELAVAIALFVISMITFDTLGNALIAPVAYVVLMSSVHLVVPFIVRRRLLLNPVAIFVAIVFLGWIWGVPGALLAAPLLASAKTICERRRSPQSDRGVPDALTLARKRDADQRGQRLGAELAHDGGAMIVHRALAQLQVRRNGLCRRPGEHKVEDLPLARGKALHLGFGLFPLSVARLLVRGVEGAPDASEQLVLAHRLLQEIHRARLHGAHRHGDVAIGGYDDDRKLGSHRLEPLDRLQSVDAGHFRVGDKTAGTAGPEGVQKL